FLNKRKAKGNIEGPGQSNSNLWFTSLDAPDHFGPATAEGGVWLDEQLAAGDFSEPFLFAGWDSRSVWIANDGEQDVFFTFEVDKNGDGDWTHLTDVPVPSLSEREYVFTGDQTGEWVRVRVDQPTKATVHFTYNDRDQRPNAPDGIFQGFSDIADNRSYGGLLYGLGDDRRAL